MAIRDLFRRRKAEERQDTSAQDMRQMMNSAEGFGSIRPGGQYIQRQPEAHEDIPAESAVRTGAEEEAYQMGQRVGAQGLLKMQGGGEAVPGDIDRGIITKDHVRKAWEDLMRYRQGKYSIERRVISSQQWWKLCNWDIIQIERSINTNMAQPEKSSTPWLFHSIARKHAELMDSYPEATIHPRAEDDKAEAQKLSDIIPIILEQCGFKDTYSDCKYQKLLEGTEVYGVFWDAEKLNGLGDVSIKKVNILNLFWEPGIEDIEDSKQVFYTYLMDNDELLAEYPQLEGKVGADATMQAEYQTDDYVPKDNKSIVVDWYYKRRVNGRQILHLCTFCCGEILSSTENAGFENGLYEDGEYPFVVGQMYKVAGSLAGYGQIDFVKDTQIDIDTMNHAMVLNTVVNATPRHFIKKDGGVNEQEYANISKPFVHVSGQLGEDSIRPIVGPQMNGYCLNMLQHKIDEMKFTSGDSDVSNGGVPAGVTAASAIAALQEQHGMTTKDIISGDYTTYKKVVKKTMSRVTQGYDIARTFRITGKNGMEESFIPFDNSGMKPQPLMNGMGLQGNMRMPEWDIEVRVQRETSYTRLSTNEMAIQFYQLGLFNPQNAMQAMMTLGMMDFKGKDEIMQKIKQNDILLQSFVQVSQIALELAQQYNPQIAEQLAGVIQQVTGAATGAMLPAGGAKPNLTEGDSMENEDAKKNNPIAERAADRAASATRPS